MENKKTYTRRTRRSRKTSASVRLAEVVARWLITTGGIGTIVAVVTVFLFLLSVVTPLFFSATTTGAHRVTADWSKAAPLQMGLDEDQLMCWALFPGGFVQSIRLDTGEVIERRKLFDDATLTASTFTPGGEEAAFGFADGSVRMGRIGFTTRFVDAAEFPQAIQDLHPGQAARWKNGMIVKTPKDQYRLQELSVDLKDPAKATKPSPVLLIDQTKTTRGQMIVVLTADGKLRLNSIRAITNQMTDETTLKLTGSDLPYKEPVGKGPPMRLYLSALGDQIYLFWKDGQLIRIDARDTEKPVVSETLNVLEDSALQVTEVECLIGKGTYLVGDSSGRVRGWFYTPSPEGGKTVSAHTFAGSGAAVVGMASSDRSRAVAVAYADGKVRLIYVTSERLMAEFPLDHGRPTRLTLAPKDDGLAVSSADGLHQWTFDAGHPEVTVKSLFTRVWYETYERPEHVWQSSAGTTGFEPKFSLVPLILGTLKASFYSLLFGVPVALLAAIYTSEFLHPRTKVLIKPGIEMMASLPSVVLGFLAGLVFAQFVEGVLPSVLACLITVPLSFVGGAYLWQLLPYRTAQVMSRWRFPFICLVLPLGLVGAVPAGWVLEQAFFQGDLRRWLDRGEGSAVGGWVFLFLPFSGAACVVCMARYVNPWLRQRFVGMSRSRIALLDIAKFLLGCMLTLLCAFLLGAALDAIGWDTRGGVFLGPYSQRNALVVGFAMGFAIIPIIYTIAEDALSAVPEHLRAGSLAAGATRWQTALRIVVPTAMSGLFSAVMIGLGRAVGETMIVLMATGNTPVMNWSIFTGFRTLAATIAVELPEAVRGDTHYRVLFLAAFTLFCMTFVLNTFAEMVRIRFRRRAYQL